jgi:hypothetical protein
MSTSAQTVFPRSTRVAGFAPEEFELEHANLGANSKLTVSKVFPFTRVTKGLLRCLLSRTLYKMGGSPLFDLSFSHLDTAPGRDSFSLALTPRPPLQGQRDESFPLEKPGIVEVEQPPECVGCRRSRFCGQDNIAQ